MEYNIYCDIETLPAGDLPDPATMKPPAQMKKADTIAKWREEEAPKLIEEEYRKRALDSMSGRILCIGVAINEDEPVCFYNKDDEQAVLVEFEKYIRESLGQNLGQMYSRTWIGHNISGFDAIWIWRRAIKYNLVWLARQFNFNRYKGNISDTMTMWACDSYQDKRSLNDVAKFLGVGGKTEGMDGSKVYPMWLAGEHEAIANYCMDDVRCVREIFNSIDGIMSMNPRR